MSQICRPVLFLLAALAVGACSTYAASDSLAGEAFEDAASAAPPEATRGGAADQAGATGGTASCPIEAIAFIDGERCASCTDVGGSVEVCGPQQIASCFELELGEVCQRCVTAGGEVLYDDCIALTDDVGLLCDQVTYDGERPQTCEVCRDQNGTVVQETCGLGALRCNEVFIDGHSCEECRDDNDAVVTRACATPDLDPSYCMAYGDDDGRCVDCYDSAGALLQHACTLTESPLLNAGEDAAGNDAVEGAVGSDVDPVPSEGPTRDDAARADEGERCELLSFAAQECRVCIGRDGRELSTRCRSLDDAVTPSSCDTSYDPQGNLCRTCPSNEAANDEETRCVAGGDFFCGVEADYDDETTDLPRLCTRCDVQGSLAYEACALGSAPATPLCEADVTANGDACERCSLEGLGDVVYSSCGE